MQFLGRNFGPSVFSAVWARGSPYPYWASSQAAVNRLPTTWLRHEW